MISPPAIPKQPSHYRRSKSVANDSPHTFALSAVSYGRQAVVGRSLPGAISEDLLSTRNPPTMREYNSIGRDRARIVPGHTDRKSGPRVSLFDTPPNVSRATLSPLREPDKIDRGSTGFAPSGP